jgi:hypothetical protein
LAKNSDLQQLPPERLDWDSEKRFGFAESHRPELSYIFVLACHGANRVPASAFNLHLTRSRIFASLTAVFFVGTNETTTGDMRADPVLNVAHDGLL